MNQEETKCPKCGKQLVTVRDDRRYLECLCGYKFDTFLSKEVVSSPTTSVESDTITVSEAPKLKDVLRFWDEHYYVPDHAPIIIALATVFSNKLSGDPLWMFLVGPPSTIKSEIIRSFGDKEDDLVFPLSTLTPNTFVSGYSEGESLAPKIDGKILTMKDFTTILQKTNDVRNEILAQLREIYDGYISKATGGDASYQNVHLKITVLAGVTPIIDVYDSVQSLLGDRFLKFRVVAGDSKKTGKAATKAAGKEAEIRKELRGLMRAFLENLEPAEVGISRIRSTQILEAAELAAGLRTAVAKDWQGIPQYMPQTEGIARIYKQLLKLSRSISLIMGKKSVDNEVIRYIFRVAFDTGDQRRVLILDALADLHDDVPTSSVGLLVKLPTNAARKVLDDLNLIGKITKSGSEDKGYSWGLEPHERENWIRYRKWRGIGTTNNIQQSQRTSYAPPKNIPNQESVPVGQQKCLQCDFVYKTDTEYKAHMSDKHQTRLSTQDWPVPPQIHEARERPEVANA
jgi:hypothetical protein